MNVKEIAGSIAFAAALIAVAMIAISLLAHSSDRKSEGEQVQHSVHQASQSEMSLIDRVAAETLEDRQEQAAENRDAMSEFCDDVLPAYPDRVIDFAKMGYDSASFELGDDKHRWQTITNDELQSVGQSAHGLVAELPACQKLTDAIEKDGLRWTVWINGLYENRINLSVSGWQESVNEATRPLRCENAVKSFKSWLQAQVEKGGNSQSLSGGEAYNLVENHCGKNEAEHIRNSLLDALNNM